MKNYAIGYKKPPLHSRFKPGASANPSGRPKRVNLTLEEQIDAVLYGKTSYIENGMRKKASRARLSVDRLFKSALKGNVKDAAQILKLRKHALFVDPGPLFIKIIGGPPDDFD